MGKLFGTDGIRAKYGKFPLTEDFIVELGKAVGYILSSQNSDSSLLVAKDTRPSGKDIEKFLIKGTSCYPIKIYLANTLPTAALSYIIRKHNINLGAMISASHNLYQDNGIKFFSSQGLKISDNFEEKIENLTINNKKENKSQFKKTKIIEDKREKFIREYIDFTKETIGDINLDGFKIVIDSAHGAVCNIADKVFEELGAEVISLNNEPDGEKINFNCGSQHPDVVRLQVLENKAHIGLSFDGDGDRVILTDEKGNVLDGDYIMAITGLYLSKKKKLNKNALVATVMSNMGLDEALGENDISVLRTKVGDKYVVRKMMEEKLNLGGEQSGHVVFFDYNLTGDGIITSLQILKLMKEENKYLNQLSKFMEKFPQVLLNIEIKEKKDFSEIPNLKSQIDEYKKELNNYGRVFVRYSGTEPVIRIMIEGKDYKVIEKMSHKLAEIIKKDIGVK